MYHESSIGEGDVASLPAEERRTAMIFGGRFFDYPNGRLKLHSHADASAEEVRQLLVKFCTKKEKCTGTQAILCRRPPPH